MNLRTCLLLAVVCPNMLLQTADTGTTAQPRVPILAGQWTSSSRDRDARRSSCTLSSIMALVFPLSQTSADG